MAAKRSLLPTVITCQLGTCLTVYFEYSRSRFDFWILLGVLAGPKHGSLPNPFTNDWANYSNRNKNL